jgi:hypothetical protein
MHDALRISFKLDSTRLGLSNQSDDSTAAVYHQVVLLLYEGTSSTP